MEAEGALKSGVAGVFAEKPWLVWALAATRAIDTSRLVESEVAR